MEKSQTEIWYNLIYSLPWRIKVYPDLRYANFLNLLQQERMCTHLRKACILEKSQDLNFINKQEGFLPSLGEPTGSALIHISRDHHRSRLFQDCKGLEETRRKHQLIKKINQEWVHGIRNELIQQRTQK